jgi:hypothetical protein
VYSLKIVWHVVNALSKSKGNFMDLNFYDSDRRNRVCVCVQLVVFQRSILVVSTAKRSKVICRHSSIIASVQNKKAFSSVMFANDET